MLFAVYSKYGQLIARVYDYDEAQRIASMVQGHVYEVIIHF